MNRRTLVIACALIVATGYLALFAGGAVGWHGRGLMATAQAAGKTESDQFKLVDQLDIRTGNGVAVTLYKVCDTDNGQTIYLYGNNQMELATGMNTDCR